VTKSGLEERFDHSPLDYQDLKVKAFNFRNAMKRRGGVAWTARYKGRNKAGFSCRFFYSHGNVLIRTALLKRIKVYRMWVHDDQFCSFS
jgi:hypothetical protein